MEEKNRFFPLGIIIKALNGPKNMYDLQEFFIEVGELFSYMSCADGISIPSSAEDTICCVSESCIMEIYKLHPHLKEKMEEVKELNSKTYNQWVKQNENLLKEVLEIKKLPEPKIYLNKN